MSLESPPRLKHGPELGPILKAAEAPIPPEQIAANGAAIKAAIAAGVVKAIPLWVKIGLPLLFVVGGYAIYRGLSSSDDRQPVVERAITTASIDAPPLVITDGEVAAIEVDATLLDAAPVVVAKKPRVEPPPLDAAELPPSDLPAQIALYEAARAEVTKGNIARGIELLDELLQRFPSTQLRAEAELTRADFLTRANRLDDAASALETLAASAVHRGRRGELLRALGDVRRKQGDCTRALDAYTRARETKLNAAETAKVDRGMERCAPRK